MHSERPRSEAEARDGGGLALAALAAAVLFWSGNFVAGRALGDAVDPVLLNFLRWMLCGLLLLPLVGRRLLQSRNAVLREWRLILLLGATGIAAFHVMVYEALTTTTAISALLILALAPPAILILSTVTEGRRPSSRVFAGTLVSLVGAVLLILAGAESSDGTAIAPGDLWMLAAVPVWAAYSVLLRRRHEDLPQDVTLAASIAAAMPMLLALLLLRTPAPFVPTMPTLVALGYIAVFASALGFLLWSFGVARVGPERAGQFLHLMPVFGSILAALLLGETIALPQVCGAVCVFAGIAMVNRRPSQGARE